MPMVLSLSTIRLLGGLVLRSFIFIVSILPTLLVSSFTPGRVLGRKAADRKSHSSDWMGIAFGDFQPFNPLKGYFHHHLCDVDV